MNETFTQLAAWMNFADIAGEVQRSVLVDRIVSLRIYRGVITLDWHRMKH
jgi:hypothetical protein